MKRIHHFWTKEEKEYLAQITYGKYYNEIINLMSKKFNYEYTYNQIKSAVKRYKLKTGFDGKFKKGHIPANKGTKGLTGSNKSSFKKGNIPSNTRKIGDERVTRDGYIEVKIALRGKWALKQRLLYEKYNDEKLTSNEVVIFADGNKQNFSKENLLKVTRQQLLILNREGLIKDDIALTKTGLTLSKLILKLQDIEKGQNGK